MIPATGHNFENGVCTVCGAAQPNEVTVSMDSFEGVSGYVENDENISFAATKGGAGTAPAVYSGVLRIYQNGGLLTITANNGVKLKEITIGSTLSTTVQTSVDGGNYSSNHSISANDTYTEKNLDSDEVVFKCTGTTSGTRLYLNYLSVTYSGGSSDTVQTITGDTEGFVGTGVELETNAETTGWTITANTCGATLSANSGKTTTVSATQAGSVTIQAEVEGYTTVTHTIAFSMPTRTLTYAVGDHGSYDGTSTKQFNVGQGSNHTVLNPTTVGITANGAYVFSTWNDGTSNYAPSSTYTMGTSNVTLTAQWVAGIALSYNKNNNSATGSTSTTFVASGETQTVSACGFSLDGYVFSHWSTASDDNGTSYSPNDEINNFTSALELFAIWEKVSYVVIDSVVTSGNMTGNNDANSKFGLSNTDWSIIGTKQSASNLPGFGSDGTTRLYGNASGGNYIVFKTLTAHRTISKISIEFNGSYSTGATVKQGEGTGGTLLQLVMVFIPLLPILLLSH